VREKSLFSAAGVFFLAPPLFENPRSFFKKKALLEGPLYPLGGEESLSLLEKPGFFAHKHVPPFKKSPP